MELMPFQVTQSPASLRSCKASDNEPDLHTSVASVLMKTRSVCRSTRASWITLRKPAPGPGSEEVGTKTTVRLCCTQSNTASCTAATNQRTDFTLLNEDVSVDFPQSISLSSYNYNSFFWV